jgi:hypothetical protein
MYQVLQELWKKQVVDIFCDFKANIYNHILGSEKCFFSNTCQSMRHYILEENRREDGSKQVVAELQEKRKRKENKTIQEVKNVTHDRNKNPGFHIPSLI